MWRLSKVVAGLLERMSAGLPVRQRSFAPHLSLLPESVIPSAGRPVKADLFPDREVARAVLLPESFRGGCSFGAPGGGQGGSSVRVLSLWQMEVVVVFDFSDTKSELGVPAAASAFAGQAMFGVFAPSADVLE